MLIGKQTPTPFLSTQIVEAVHRAARQLSMIPQCPPLRRHLLVQDTSSLDTLMLRVEEQSITMPTFQAQDCGIKRVTPRFTHIGKLLLTP